MAIHKLILDDFIEENFNLLAVHSSLEGYQLAYLLNQKLSISLKYNAKLKPFDLFEFKNDHDFSLWHLARNKGYSYMENNSSINTLFNTDHKKINYLIPEHKKVDFFIKIEHQSNCIKNIIYNINTIPQIITTFAIAPENLKSKNNLIFH